MKKLKFLLVILAAVLVLPFSVFAEETEDTGSEAESAKSEVNLYFFHGNGCPHCEDAQTWFDEIEEEYGDKFNVVAYEVWYDMDNNNLMSAVAEARGEAADGVPYIIVGNQSWSGFAESYEDEIISKIESEYEVADNERYDVMDYVQAVEEEDSSTAKDVLILIIILALAGGIGAGVVFARKKTN